MVEEPRCFRCGSVLDSPEAALKAGLIDAEACGVHGGVAVVPLRAESKDGAESSEASGTSEPADAGASEPASESTPEPATETRRDARGKSRVRRAAEPDRSDA